MRQWSEHPDRERERLDTLADERMRAEVERDRREEMAGAEWYCAMPQAVPPRPRCTQGQCAHCRTAAGH